jgi:uncharacterized protein (DUF433 family)
VDGAGQSPDEIVAAHPQLTLADVYAAMAYYFDNREVMDRLIESDERFIADMELSR